MHSAIGPRRPVRHWGLWSHRFIQSFAATLCLLTLSACATGPTSTDTGGATETSETIETTRPNSPAPPPPTAEELRHEAAVDYVDALTLRQQVASVIMSTSGGTDIDALTHFVADDGLGGFLLMGGNIPESPETLNALTAAMRGPDPHLPRLISIDEEGGIVTRIPWDSALGANDLRSLDVDTTRTAFAQRAALLSGSGVTVNFGIVADISSDPSSFIYWRTLGDNPSDAAARVAAAVAGEHGQVASTLKHFPGHGAVAADSHFTIPQSLKPYDEWLASDAVPFAAGIDSGAELLMFGHLSYASVDPLPASLSTEWHRIAREELGFRGVIVSDDLGMLLNSGLPGYDDLSVLTSQALTAGTDLVLLIQGTDPSTMPSLIDAITASVEAGSPSRDRLREAAIRVAELRLLIGERIAG